MYLRALAFVALAFTGFSSAAQQSPPIPIGVSGDGASSIAWVLDADKNRMIVCRVQYGAGGGRICNVIPFAAR
jgi:hypothetical protein